MPYEVVRVRPDLPGSGEGLVKIPSVPEDGLARLVSQYRGLQPRVQGLVGSFLEPIQLLDDTAIDAIEAFDIDIAAGVLLDRLGVIVGEPRRGRSDSAYRRGLRTRIRSNSSFGRAEDLIDVALVFVGSGVIRFFEGLMWAYVESNAPTPAPVDLMRFLVLAKAAGVALVLIYRPETLLDGDEFTLSGSYAAGETNSSTGLGSVYTATGGAFYGAFLSTTFDASIITAYTPEITTRAGTEITTRTPETIEARG